MNNDSNPQKRASLHSNKQEEDSTTTQTMPSASSPPSASLPNNTHHDAFSSHQQHQQVGGIIMPSIPLAELPLRPSTVSLLKKRGFVTTAELEDARIHQGVATLSAELDLTLPETANLLMEVQGCLRVQQQQQQQQQEQYHNLETTTNATADTASIDTSVAIPPILNARDLLFHSRNNNNESQNHIVTYCQDLDQLLGGGIALGQVTEIVGLPGTGKTQLAMQLAVMCRLPKLFGGVEGKTLYVDTEGSFAPERCAQMATALAQHVQIRIKRAREQQQQSPQQMPKNNDNTTILTERDFLESIQVFRVHDEASQTATLQTIPQHYLNNSRDAVPVKLIVIDSIAFHYRAMMMNTKRTSSSSSDPSSSNHNHSSSYQHYGQRTKSLIRLAGFLADLARSHHLAVVCINQMTTKMISSSSNKSNTTSDGNNNKSSMLVPALGESWAHAVTTRLLLQQASMPNGSGDTGANHHQHHQYRQWRTCQLVKSPHRPSGMVTFQITPQGIRRVPTSNSNTTTSRNNHQQQRQSSQTTRNTTNQNQHGPKQLISPPPQPSSSSSSSSSLPRRRRPLQPHNLKPPPSYSTTTTTTTTPVARGNPAAQHYQQNNNHLHRAPIPTPPGGPSRAVAAPAAVGMPNARSTPVMRRPPPPQPFPNNNHNNNTPHHRTVTPHPLSNPPHSSSSTTASSSSSSKQQQQQQLRHYHHPLSTPDLEAIKRRRLL